MFRIPSFYRNAMSFDEAIIVMKSHGRGDLLEGMQAMDRCWTEHCASRSDDDDEFWDNYEVEANAYNAVFENMEPLFQ